MNVLRFLRALVLGLILFALTAHAAESWTFVTRKGDALYEGGKEFRFIGLAAPNIQAHESQLHPDFSNRFPDDFETRDLLSSFQRLG